HVGLTPNPDYAPTIPHQTYMIYQAMFAIITPALITGAFAERMKFSAFVVFSLLWATLVYDPLAHMVWGTGGLVGKVWGALDFAGGTVVHISSGTSALVCAIVIGKRLGFGSEPMPPHNLPLTVTGAALLWVGWFGFNAGSAVAANALATSAFVATNTATAAAALSWMGAEWLGKGKPTVLGAASGAVAGLVAITPASGFVEPMPALVIGAVAGVLCYSACNLKAALGWYDDALDVVGVHGVGGTWGAIATGLWATARSSRGSVSRSTGRAPTCSARAATGRAGRARSRRGRSSIPPRSPPRWRSEGDDLYKERRRGINEWPASRARGGIHEEGRGDHQTVQARRGEGEPLRHRGAGHHRERSEGLRTAEGAHRALPGGRVRRRFPAEGETRDH